mgnify:FL=1
MHRSALSILQVSTADILGGAESIARNLHLAYRQAGHDAYLAVGRKRSDDHNTFRIPNEAATGRWRKLWWGLHAAMQPHFARIPAARTIARTLQSLAEPAGWLDRRHGIEDFHFPGSHRLLDLTPHIPDIVHFHNLHGGYFDLSSLPHIFRPLSFFLTLHDAWLLAGHCAHSFDCDRWKTGCGSCPDLTIYPAIRRDATSENWRRKAEIFTQCRLYVTAPCKWLLDRADESLLAPAIIESHVIPNGVDQSIFKPGDMRAARRSLNLSPDAAIVLFVANSPRRNPFKDYETLRRAVALLARKITGRPLLLLALGGEGPTEQVEGAEIRHLPATGDANTVADYYRAADLYLHAARVDTFPNTLIEALSCGRPVVATAVGGIPEQVRSLPMFGHKVDAVAPHGATGILTPAGDADAMAQAAEFVLHDGHIARAMSTSAANDAQARFSLQTQVSRFLDWYEFALETAVDTDGVPRHLAAPSSSTDPGRPLRVRTEAKPTLTSTQA